MIGSFNSPSDPTGDVPGQPPPDTLPGPHQEEANHYMIRQSKLCAIKASFDLPTALLGEVFLKRPRWIGGGIKTYAFFTSST